jgi:uncharacterized protein
MKIRRQTPDFHGNDQVIDSTRDSDAAHSFRAPPFENVGKRQRKAPKAYVRDSGMLHTLLSLDSPERLLSHPALGASFEGSHWSWWPKHCRRATSSMTQAREHLQLDALKVVYPGTRRYSLGERVEAMPLAEAVEWARRGAP